MATGSPLTLVDLARRTDPNGDTAEIAELLSMADEIYDDLVWKEGNTNTGHVYTVRTSIPPGWWRFIGQGVPMAKTTTAQGHINCGLLEEQSTIDRELLEMAEDENLFRYWEDNGILQGMTQTIARTFMYGNNPANPAQFTGLSAFYPTVNTAISQSAANVFDGGGLGSNNASIWGVGWSPRTIYGVFPKGSKAGLTVEPLQQELAYDAAGNPYRSKTTWFRQKVGLCVEDWRWGFRICNLDVTNAGLAGPSAYDIFVGLDAAVLRLPKMAREVSGITETDAKSEAGLVVRPAIYSNRTIRHFCDVQAIRDRNVLLGPNDYAGGPVTKFRGVPMRIMDVLLNSESRVV